MSENRRSQEDDDVATNRLSDESEGKCERASWSAGIASPDETGSLSVSVAAYSLDNTAKHTRIYWRVYIELKESPSAGKSEVGEQNPLYSIANFSGSRINKRRYRNCETTRSKSPSLCAQFRPFISLIFFLCFSSCFGSVRGDKCTKHPRASRVRTNCERESTRDEVRRNTPVDI